MTWYAGDSSELAREVKSVYAGNSSGVAQRITRAYVGDPNGIARQIFPRTYLPAGYIQVEYIEGTGTQYIDTGVNLTATNFALECTFALTTITYNTNTYMMGTFYGTRLFIMIGSSDKKLTLGIGNGWYAGSITTTYMDKHVYKVDMKNLKAYIDGVSKAKNSSNAYSRSTGNKGRFMLFNYTASDGKVGSSSIKGKCYSAKIWQNDDLIRDYYPCYRISDGEPGMYDAITDTFLTNAGTGVFLVGPKHEEEL